MLCPPGWGRGRDTSLRLRDLELWLVWRGRGWMKSADREYTLLPGFCALMRPGGIYDAGQDEANPLAITFIHFDLLPDKENCRAAIDYQLLPEFFEVGDTEYFDAVTRRIIEIHHHDRRLGAILLKALLLDLLQRPQIDQTHRVPTGARAQALAVARLAASIRASSASLPTVPEMADELQLSRAHFSRVFRRVTLQTPREFLVQIRVARARQLLLETNLRVGEIADRLDYADVYFFSRQFKAKTGVSPSNYRTKAFLRKSSFRKRTN